jgi:uncharacterized protein with von Willebrand factor type A (vWA) domain
MEWATAIALALVDLAAGRRGSSASKRRSHVLYFNERVVHEVAFAPGERDPRKLLSVATVGAGGGTDYRAALDRALEILAGGAPAYAGADVLLVTDAICALDDEYVRRLLAEKGRMGFALYSVLIGSADTTELARYSDEVFCPTDLTGSEAGPDGVAGEVFGRFS